MKRLLIASIVGLSGCKGPAEAPAPKPTEAAKPAEAKPAEAKPAEAAPSAAALVFGAAPPMATVEMESTTGAKVSIASVKGEKGTLVIFTCNHCPFVKKWEDRITALGNEFMSKGGGVIAINSNDPAANPEDGMEGMKQRAAEKGMKFPYVVDDTSNVARAFGATKTPEVFVFDKADKLMYHGAIDDNADDATKVQEAYLKAVIAALDAGAPILPRETKALGCSIKMREPRS